MVAKYTHGKRIGRALYVRTRGGNWVDLRLACAVNYEGVAMKVDYSSVSRGGRP
ncbi:hypothetical protein BN871_AT_00650 [Paenibacillus sp. P22]|nr:hypothetical protein BN871_AT_00650 [Paenibacillus sp. P22]